MSKDIFAEMGINPEESQSRDIFEDLGIKSEKGNKKNPLIDQFAGFLGKNVLEPLARSHASNPETARGNYEMAEHLRPLEQAFEEGPLVPGAAGFLQGYGNSLISSADVPLSIASEISGKNMRIPTVNLEQYLPEEQQGGLAAGVGDVLGQSLGAAGVFKGLGALQKYGPKAMASTKGFTGYLKDIFKGGLAGYTTGASKEGEGELTDFGRMLSALAGKATAAVGSGAKRASGLTSKKIASKIESGTREVEKKSSELFDSSIEEGVREGIDLGVPKPGPGQKKAAIRNARKTPEGKVLLGETSNFDTKHIFKEYLKNPNLKTAHTLVKQLGHDVAKYGGKERSILENNVAKAAKKYRERLINTMDKSFIKNERPDLSEGLKEANKHFKEHVLPHRIEPITDYLKGEYGLKYGMTPNRLMKKLANSPDFELALSNRYPEVMNQKLLKKMGLGAVGVAGVGTAGTLGNHLLKPTYEGKFK